MAFLTEPEDVPDARWSEPMWGTYASGYRWDVIVQEARRQRAAWLGRHLRRLFGGVSEMLARRRRQGEMQDLLALDERTLADIGLRREDLWSVVRGQVRFEELAAQRSARTTSEVVGIHHRRPFVPADELDHAA